MIIDDNLKQILSRYNAFLNAVYGLFGAAMYSEFPTSQKTKTELRSKLNDALDSAFKDIDGMISEAIENSLAVSFDIALQNDYEIDEQRIDWEALSELMTLQNESLSQDMFNQMQADMSSAIKRFNEFRLKVSARRLSGEAVERHLIVSEREKAFKSFSIKFTDSAGRKYGASHYASKRINWSVRSLQRQSMYFLLMSMGDSVGQVLGGSNDGAVVDINEVFNIKSLIFHYGSNALLIKSVVTN